MEQIATGLLVIGWKLALALIAGSSALTTVCVYLLARFTHAFDAYAEERAKLLAHFHNLDKLVEETKKLTATTEAIKARISDEVWDRQMRWEAKRQAYIGVLLALNRAISAEIAYRTHWNAVAAAGDDLGLRNRHEEETRRAVEQRLEALRDLSRAAFTASITTGPACVALLNELGPVLGRISEGSLDRTGTDLDMKPLYAVLNRLQVVAIDDLKVDFRDIG